MYLYVDHITKIESGEPKIVNFNKYMMNEFKISNLEVLPYFLRNDY